MVTCSITDCPEPSRARGWCLYHYKRWHRGYLTDADQVVEVRPQLTSALPDLLEIEGGTWTAEALAMRIGARPDTVRRQLSRLKNRGLVERTYGGWRLA